MMTIAPGDSDAADGESEGPQAKLNSLELDQLMAQECERMGEWRPRKRPRIVGLVRLCGEDFPEYEAECDDTIVDTEPAAAEQQDTFESEQHTQSILSIAEDSQYDPIPKGSQPRGDPQEWQLS